MNGIFLMEESYIIAVIMKVKRQYFMENFVTFKELNTVRQQLHKKFKEKDLNVRINDTIDKDFFEIHGGVILINHKNNITMKQIEDKYQGHCPSIEILLALWDEEYIYQILVNLKKEEYENLYQKNEEKKEITSPKRVKISLVKLGFLVSMLECLNLDNQTERELLSSYYKGLNQCKQNGFTNNQIDITDKLHLINYLTKREMLVCPKQQKEKNTDLKKIKKKKNT